MDVLQFFELPALFGILRRLDGVLLFLDDLAANVLDVVLMLLFELFIDLSLDLVLDASPRAHIGNTLGKAHEDLRDLRLRGRRRDERVLFQDALEGEDALCAALTAQEFHRIHAPCANDELFRADEVDERSVNRVNLAVNRLGHRRLPHRFPMPRRFLLVKKPFKKNHSSPSCESAETVLSIARSDRPHFATTLTLILLVTLGWIRMTAS